MLEPAVLERLDLWGEKALSDNDILPVLWDLAALEKTADQIAIGRGLVGAMRDSLADKIRVQPAASLQDQRDALVSVIHYQYRFGPDKDIVLPDTINLATVIERRKGLPIALAVLYMDLALSQGWSVRGINFPGHFLIQLGQGNQTILIDPNNGDVLQASDLRRLLKETLGVHAELQHNHYKSVDAPQIIMRYYNNQKTAYIQTDDVHNALGVSEALLRVVPNEARLYYDAAVLATRLDYYQAAIGYWQKFIALSTDKTEKDEARYILSRLETALH
jgi:regulator of sirC expression with transglutaminase-like and TPR domain